MIKTHLIFNSENVNRTTVICLVCQVSEKGASRQKARTRNKKSQRELEGSKYDGVLEVPLFPFSELVRLADVKDLEKDVFGWGNRFKIVTDLDLVDFDQEEVENYLWREGFSDEHKFYKKSKPILLTKTGVLTILCGLPATSYNQLLRTFFVNEVFPQLEECMKVIRSADFLYKNGLLTADIKSEEFKNLPAYDVVVACGLRRYTEGPYKVREEIANYEELKNTLDAYFSDGCDMEIYPALDYLIKIIKAVGH